MKLERLNRERWHELDFSEFGEDSPPSESAEIYALVDTEEIVGYFVIERGITHVGPFKVKESLQGNGIGSLLAEHAARLTEGEEVYVAATTPHTERMCERFGLTRVLGSLWVKEG